MLFLLNPRLTEEDCERLMKQRADSHAKLMATYERCLESFETPEAKAEYAKAMLPVLWLAML